MAVKGEPFTGGQCRTCWNYLNDDSYYRLAEELPQVDDERRRPQYPCRHIGEETGETRQCPPCVGNVQIKLLKCDIHGSCTSLKQVNGVAWCLTCKQYTPRIERFSSPPIRDLAYHIYPLAGNGAWQWNVRQLLTRISLFNGKRIVAISHDGRCDSVEQVKTAFRGEIEDQDFIVVRNNPGAPETTTLPLMLERLETRDPNRCLLRAHAKGVSRWEDAKLSSVIRDWSLVLYESLLDYWPLVEEQLTTHSVTGAFRWQTRMWPHHSVSDWFYSGSWYWIRSHHLFKYCDWRKVDQFWAGIESYPSIHFPFSQSACVVCDNAGNVYDGRHWNSHLRPTYDRWATENWDKRTDRYKTGSLTLATVITENYLPRARAFLSSLSVVKSAKCFCICNGWYPSSELAREFPHVTFRYLPKHFSESFGMLQHGRCFDALPELSDDDLCLVCDADVIVQRDIDKEQLSKWNHYDGNTIGMGWNAGPGDNLLLEARRIHLGDYGASSQELESIPVYNCGVMVARKDLWNKLRDEYEFHCEDFYAHTSHRSRCQWLINWCISKRGFKVDLMPYETHSNGHFGRPSEVDIRGSAAMIGDKIITFRHRLP